MEIRTGDIIDDLAQKMYGLPADELTTIEYENCQKEAAIFLKERETERQRERL